MRTTQGTTNLILKACQACQKLCHVFPNRVTIWLQKKHAHGPAKSCHSSQIVSRFGTFTQVHFLSHISTTSMKFHPIENNMDWRVSQYLQWNSSHLDD